VFGERMLDDEKKIDKVHTLADLWLHYMPNYQKLRVFFK